MPSNIPVPLRNIRLFFVVMGMLILSSNMNVHGQSTPPRVLSSDWLMQDVAHVKESGEAISKVGFAPPVYAVKPYVPPSTASANAPTATVIPDEVRYARGAGRGDRQ